MAGSRNGTVSVWKDKKIQKEAKLFDEWTLVLNKNDRIFAASKNKDILELNMNLETIKKFKGRKYRSFSMDSSDSYLVVGYNNFDKTNYVDVHSRKELGQNGYHKRMVSNF